MNFNVLTTHVPLHIHPLCNILTEFQNAANGKLKNKITIYTLKFQKMYSNEYQQYSVNDTISQRKKNRKQHDKN